VATANLLAFVFGLKQTRDRAGVTDMATKITVAEFVPRTDVQIAQTDDEYKQNRENVTIGRPTSFIIPCVFSNRLCMSSAKVKVHRYVLRSTVRS